MQHLQSATSRGSAASRVRRAAAAVVFLGAALSLPHSLSAVQRVGALDRTEAVHHVLTRLTYGPRPGQARDVGKSGWQAWVETQLDPPQIDDSVLDQRLQLECPTLSMSLSELQRLSQTDPQEAERRVKEELRTAVLLRAVYSERQLLEVIVNFWRNHFNVDVNKVPFLAAHFEEHVLRAHAFGSFEELLLATAEHPAMLVYLDNYISNRRGLNENYARELMELHTLGVDNGYVQEDVVSLARLLTGWTCGWQGDEYKFYFDEAAHDAAPVKWLGRDLGGRGVVEGRRAIRHLSRHPNTARFIATKLCRYLVNDEPSEKLIADTAQVFLDTEGDLLAVYRAIIFSDEFTSETNFRAKVKTPFEYVVSVLRAVAAEIESPQEIFRQLDLMGQPIYECLEPTGYSDQREAWLDPGVMIYRWNFAISLVTQKVEGVSGGEAFVNPVLEAPAAERPEMVMRLLLPGGKDDQLASLMAFTADPRLLTAYALGSPMFQQQ